MANVQDWSLEVSDFELQSWFYFQTNTPWEKYEPPDPPAMG